MALGFNLEVLARAIPVAVLVFSGEALADAAPCPSESGSASEGAPYYDPCADFDGWTKFELLSGGTIPTDGVLVLQGEFRGALPPGPETVVLTVTSEGVPLAGSVEASEFPWIVLWRPDTAWTPGAEVAIEGAATNADGDINDACLLAELPVSGSVTIAEGPGEALKPVEISATETLEVLPTISLATLACCPGAAPGFVSDFCGGQGGYVSFDPEQCAPTEGTGVLSLALTGTPAATGGQAAQVRYRLRVGDSHTLLSELPEFSRNTIEPLCLAIDAFDLATEEVVPGVEACFGEAVADQLGPQVLDPEAVLTGCEPRTCPLSDDGMSWDLEACGEDVGLPTGGPVESEGSGSSGETGAQDDGEKGCACDATAGSPGLLGLAGLGLLGLRRRRR